MLWHRKLRTVIIKFSKGTDVKVWYSPLENIVFLENIENVELDYIIMAEYENTN